MLSDHRHIFGPESCGGWVIPLSSKELFVSVTPFCFAGNGLVVCLENVLRTKEVKLALLDLMFAFGHSMDKRMAILIIFAPPFSWRSKRAFFEKEVRTTSIARRAKRVRTLSVVAL